MRSRLFALVMAALLLLYLALVAQLAVRLLLVDEPVAKALGVALLVLPAVGLWALVAELVFGMRSERLGARLAETGGLPMQELPRLPSGRIERAAAEAAFDRYRAEADAEPARWESWYRLGLAYDACGDRSRARRAIRKAIALDRGRDAAGLRPGSPRA